MSTSEVARPTPFCISVVPPPACASMNTGVAFTYPARHPASAPRSATAAASPRPTTATGARTAGGWRWRSERDIKKRLTLGWGEGRMGDMRAQNLIHFQPLTPRRAAAFCARNTFAACGAGSSAEIGS